MIRKHHFDTNHTDFLDFIEMNYSDLNSHTYVFFPTDVTDSFDCCLEICATAPSRISENRTGETG